MRANQLQVKREIHLMGSDLSANSFLVPSFPSEVIFMAMPNTIAAKQQWVDINNAIFAAHPEQGHFTVADLEARMQLAWFKPEHLVFMYIEEKLIGYVWNKIEQKSQNIITGEVYAIGVSTAYQGKGYGNLLFQWALEAIGKANCQQIFIYVEADNLPAIRLYEKYGIRIISTDVQLG